MFLLGAPNLEATGLAPLVDKRLNSVDLRLFCTFYHQVYQWLKEQSVFAGGSNVKISESTFLVWLLTWWDSGGDSRGGQLALAFGGHSCHFDSVCGESGEACDPVLQGDIRQIVGDSGVGPVELLP